MNKYSVTFHYKDGSTQMKSDVIKLHGTKKKGQRPIKAIVYGDISKEQIDQMAMIMDPRVKAEIMVIEDKDVVPPKILN